MVEAYKMRDLAWVLELLHIRPDNWEHPTMFRHGDLYYVPVGTIDGLVDKPGLAEDTRQEISDVLKGTKIYDVTPAKPYEKPKVKKSQYIDPPKDNETSVLCKPFHLTCPLHPGLNERLLRAAFQKRNFARTFTDSIEAYVGALNAAADREQITDWKELAPYVPERYRNENLLNFLVKSGYFCKTLEGGITIKPVYRAGDQNAN